MLSMNNIKLSKLAHTKKVILQGTIRHVLINQNPLIPISTISNQIDKVRMVKKTQHQNLYKKFSVSLESIPVELLNSDYLSEMKNTKSLNFL